MFTKSVLLILMLTLSLCCIAQEETKPVELELLKTYVGVWDAEIEVWPKGINAASIKFKGVEKNRLYGEHWIVSDFDSEYMGETIKVHSIVGYDLDQKKLVGTAVDHGPYMAKMTGNYDEKSKTVQWKTEVKDLQGKMLVQKTLVTQKNADERIIVLMVPDKKTDNFVKFMEVKLVKRK